MLYECPELNRCNILVVIIRKTAFTKHNFVHYGIAILLVMLLSACASKPPKVQDEPPNWEVMFDRQIEFQSLVNDDLLVVGTNRHLYGVDPDSGQQLWRQRNVAATRNDLVSLGKGSYLLVNDATGGAFDDRDTHIIALDQKSGAMVWESRLLEGKILQGTLGESGEVLFFTSVLKAHGDDRGFLSGAFGKGMGSGFEQQPYLNALDVSTGRMLWTRAFVRPVLMRPVHRPQLDDGSDYLHTRPFDLGLYHPPVAAGSMVCVTYDGVTCYDARTGQPVWDDRFAVLEDELGLSYANPVLDGETIITTGQNRVRAFDSVTGEARWRSERLSIVAELQMDERAVYGQLGGRFFHIDKEEWEWDGNFGAFALDKTNGKTIWKYQRADDSITNLLVNDDKIWLADESHLVALDRKTGKVKIKLRHKFEDAPVYTALNEAGQIVVVGEHEVSAFDPEGHKSLWYVNHPPVRPGAWRRFGRGLLRLTGNVLKFSSFVLSQGVGLLPSLVAPIGSVDFKIINTKRIVSNTLRRSGRRMTYQSVLREDGVGNANLSGNFQYFVTKPKRIDHVVLAVVNLSTGETERLVRMDAQYPNVVINEGHNKIYETSGQKLVALPMETDVSNYTALSGQPAQPLVSLSPCCGLAANLP